MPPEANRQTDRQKEGVRGKERMRERIVRRFTKTLFGSGAKHGF